MLRNHLLFYLALVLLLSLGLHAEAQEGSAVQPPSVQESERSPFLGVGLVLDLLVSSGKPSSTSLSAGEMVPSGSTGLSVPVLLSIKGYVPLTPMLRLVPGMEIGYFHMSGSGDKDLPNDPDFGSFSYSWTIDNLPLFVGLALEFKPVADLPLYLSAGGGFAAAYAWARSTYEKEGQPSISDPVQSDWGLGYYLGLEAGWAIWLGRITFEYRYSSARTDLGFADIYGDTYNSELGDLEGHNLMFGYRFEF